jgi:hypothetical protein
VAVFSDPAGARARFLLEAVANDGHVFTLKIFNARGITLYATDSADVGVREENAVMRSVLRDRRPEIETTMRGDLSLYEIYVPVETRRPRLAQKLLLASRPPWLALARPKHDRPCTAPTTRLRADR